MLSNWNKQKIKKIWDQAIKQIRQIIIIFFKHFKDKVKMIINNIVRVYL